MSMYTTEFGACLHKAELVEKEFLDGLGVDTTLLYPEIETHVESLSDIFDYDKDETTLNDLDISYVEFEEIRSKAENLDAVCDTLSDMKRFAMNMGESKNKKILLSYFEKLDRDIF